jgi:hypothetical protein
MTIPGTGATPIRRGSVTPPKTSELDRPSSEADLINLVFDQIVERLPGTWIPRLTIEPGFGRGGAEAFVELSAPDGQRASLLIEAKPTLNTRDVPAVELQMKRALAEIPDVAWPLIVARYLSPPTRNLLRDLGLSYADATGNLRLALDNPAVFLEGTGADSDPWRGPDREMNSLRGVPATKVTRALLDYMPPFGIRQLSELSDVSLGSTYRVVDFLEREAMLTRNGSGTVISVDWQDLIWRWSEDYDFPKKNRTAGYLEPRGLEALKQRLKLSVVRYAITGSVAAAAVARYTDPRAITLFVEDLDSAAEDLQLRPAPKTSNVILAVPYDPVAFERGAERDGLNYAALSQVSVDLLSGPGRAPTEAEALIAWMARNEPQWRSPVQP